MSLARWQRTITDNAGDVLANASIEVRREVLGAPLEPLYSDRDGLTPIGNPFTADADGFAAFHCLGGAFQITATKVIGGVPFVRTWRYVGIGTAQERDSDFPAVLGSVSQTRIGGLWTNEPNFKPHTVTISIATPGVITWNNHGRSAGQVISFATTGALPTGIVAGTKYFVLESGLTTNTLQISATLGGAPVNTSGSQSGTHTAYIQGVNIARFERVFIGAASDNDGTQIPVGAGADWLEALAEFTVSNAELAVVANSGRAAFVAGTRSSDNNQASGFSIPGQFYAINDNAAFPQSSIGIYIEAHRHLGAGPTLGMEIGIVELSNTAVEIRPYSIAGNVSAALWLESGGEEPSAFDSGAAIVVLPNPNKFKRGIVFDKNALTGADGVTGTAEAIAMGMGHQLAWYFGPTNKGFSLLSQVGAAADEQSLLVDVNGFKFLNNTGAFAFRVDKVAGAITGSLVAIASTGAVPELQAEGSASDINLGLRAKGAGQVTSHSQIFNINNASGQLRVNGTQVVTVRQAAVADATGGTTTDAQARTAINALLARLRTHGLIAP